MLIAVTTVRTVCPCVVGVVAVAARMFSEEQLEQLRSFPDIGRDDLIRYFTLTQAEMAFVDPGRGRGPADRWALPFSSARCHGWGSCRMPTNASWANPIEAHFGPLRTFVMGTADHPDHPALARRLQAYLRWRNAHARHPGVLAAQRRERARIRSERQQRWGRPRPKAA